MLLSQQLAWFRGRDVVGLTAGTSTPDWVIEEVREWLEALEQECPSQLASHA